MKFDELPAAELPRRLIARLGHLRDEAERGWRDSDRLAAELTDLGMAYTSGFQTMVGDKRRPLWRMKRRVDQIVKKLLPLVENGAATELVNLQLRLRRDVPDRTVYWSDDLRDCFERAIRLARTQIREPVRPEPPVEPRKATWFSKATHDALYPDLLKKAARDGRILKVGRGRSVQYIAESVCREYPQYRHKIEVALLQDRNQSEPDGTRRND